MKWSPQKGSVSIGGPLEICDRNLKGVQLTELSSLAAQVWVD